MKKKALVVALVTVVALALASPAVAGHGSWFLGTGFQIGGVHFQIGYQELRGGWGHPHFRVSVPLGYRGYGCSDACYRAGGAWYHHHTCPLVQHHFRMYGYEPWGVIGLHAPGAVPFAYRGPQVYGYAVPYGYHAGPSLRFYYGAPYRHDDRYDRSRRHRHDDRYYDRGRRDQRWDRGRHDRGRHRGRGRHDDHRWDRWDD